MQLLSCCPIPTAEFASLSLLLKQNDPGAREDYLSVASPVATIPLSTVACCIHELHAYVAGVREASDEPAADAEGRPAGDQFLLDDSSSAMRADPVNVFRPARGHGIAIQYAILTDTAFVQQCASVILKEGGGGNNKGRVESVVGVIFSVGVSGVPYAHSSSSLVNTMSRRMGDFLSVLRGLNSFADPAEGQTCIKALLSTAILTNDEERKTNEMADLEAVTLMADLEGDSPSEKIKSVISPIGTVRKTKRSHNRRASLKGSSIDTSDMKLMVTATSSADVARITAEKVAILSVSEQESQLRKYEATGVERRSIMASSLGKTKAVRARRRKDRHEADLEGFDCLSMSPSKEKSAPIALSPSGTDTASIQIPAAKTYRPPRNTPKKSALPTLLAPRNDVATKRASQQSSRRWSLNGPRAIGASPPVTPASSDVSTPREAAFNAFSTESAVNTSFANGSFPNQQFAGVNDQKGNTNGTANHAASSGRDAWGMVPSAATTEFNAVGEGEQQRAPRFEFSASDPSDERELALSPHARPGNHVTSDNAVNSLEQMLLAAERSEMNGLKDDDETSRGSRSVASFQNGEWLQGMDEELRSAHSELDNLVAKVTPSDNGAGAVEAAPPRLMINVALNEDLTCSYRQSKMSSCSIEGVVQVQVSCDTRDGVPFFLLVRDPSRHIRIVQENKRFADNMSGRLLPDSSDDTGVDYKYTVSVPSADDYFPVMRYKCSTELRPVPIRVQTRVRVNEGGSCRVALQISSNPANEDDLTDLTIVMGVPLEVKGETLVTTPAGGVWNGAKRSVIWCVAELGDGEKFQLQAEFEMDPSSPPLPSGTKPKFPVLVRCQCMYAQLSDVELEVSDIADVFPADVTMKMARRFRLSHRERS